MEIVAALKLPDGTIFIGRFSHAKAMYALLQDIPDPSQELLDNIVEGFIDMKTNKFIQEMSLRLFIVLILIT